MIHMDVDLHPSPSSAFQVRSFRQVSMSSGKRARSPDAETACARDHRPSKRLFLATSGFRFGATDYSAEREHSPASSYGIPSASTSRHPSEDWVKQAGGLSIDSPMFRESESANSYECLRESGDVDMAMDMEESTSTLDATKGPSTTTLSRPGLGHRPEGSSTPLERMLLQPHPQINIVPASSVTPQGQSSTADRASSSSSPSGMTTSPMSLSPAQSFNQLMPPRRPRVTMGPRADCEKCQLRVKGHWMHFE